MMGLVLAACDGEKKGYEYALDFEFFEAVPCTYAGAPALGSIAAVGLLVWFAIGGSIYLRTGSVVLPFGLLFLTGGAILPLVAAPGVGIALLTVLLVGGGVIAFAYHTFSP